MEREGSRKKLFQWQSLASAGGTMALAVIMLLGNNTIAASTTLYECMSKSIETAEPDTTVAELQSHCEEMIAAGTAPKQEGSGNAVVEERIRHDRKHILQPFTLMAHRPNYLLGAAYNGNGYDNSHWQASDPGRQWEDTEAQFQLSIKFPLLVNLMDDKFDIYGAYTNRSFWQIYDSDSAPFRETNHEPEIWIQFHPEWELWGFKNSWNSIGLNHQSNGQGGELSRSWNRVFAWFTVEKGNLAMSVRPWYRIPDDDDDNPDLTDYLGHFDLTASYLFRKHVFSVMSRNNIESGFSQGAVEASWSFPLGDWPYLKGYVKWFSGYGQSLIDYDSYVNSIGIGISLTDWL